jgi:hypothetical protein
MKRLLVEHSTISTLSGLDKELPLFNLRSDLMFLQCKNKINMEKRSIDKVDLRDLANCLNSDYFEQMAEIFKERFDLILKTLIFYQERVQNQKQELIPNNTLSKYFSI